MHRVGTIWAVGIFLGALALRGVYLAETADSPLIRGTYVDTQWHAEWARAIADGRWAQDRPFFRAPGYPLFLGGALRLTGSFMGARVVQHLLGALACVGVAWLGTRVCGPRSGRTAGIVCALYGPLMYFENELLIPALAVPLFVALLCCAVWALETPRVTAWLLCGVLLGLCAVCRPNFLALSVVLLVVCTCRAGPDARSGRWRRAAAMLCGMGLVVAPATAHNVIFGKQWVLISSQGGINFWIGNNDRADGRTATAPGRDLARIDHYVDNVWLASRSVAEREAGASLSDTQVSRFWFWRGLQFWVQQPGTALALTARKAYYFFNAFEIESNRSMYLDRSWSTVFAALVWEWPCALPGALLWPLAVIGACLPGERRLLLNTLRALAIVYALTVVAFFVTARFRMPLVPLAAVFAARAVWYFVDARATRFAGPARLWGLALLVVAALSNSAWWQVRQIDVARQASIVATAHVQLGEYAAAVQAYRQALDVDPNRYTDRHNLALALQACGRIPAAIVEMNSAVHLAPDNPDAHNELGNLLAESRRVPEALASYRRAIALAPQAAMPRANLGMTLLDAGQFEDALVEMDRAIELRPRKAAYHYARALALHGLGNPAAARAALQDTLGIDARFAPAHCTLAELLQDEQPVQATQHRQLAAALGMRCE